MHSDEDLMKSNFYSKNVLTKIISPIKKYKIIGFDIETHGYLNKIMIAGLFDDKYKHFFDKLDFIYYVEKTSQKNSYYVATNLGFDFQGIFWDTPFWNDYKLIMKNGMTLCASHNKVHMIDTMNYTKASVKELGKQIGIEKLKYKEMLGKVPRTKNQWRNLLLYNSKDCQVSKIWLEKFQESLNELGCELKMTIASCAMDLFRRKYLEKSIYKEKIKKFSDGTLLKTLIYNSYYGGRVETFKRGKLPNKSYHQKNKYYYWRDYNSAYPFQMLRKYPLPESAHISEQSSIKLIKKYHGCSDVIVTCPYMRYPLLPYRKNEKLIFPYGTFRGTYNHIELREALKLGYKIKKIYKTIYYTRTFKPFVKYIKTLYALRMKYKKEKNIIMVEVCKILMNSLYGKFAMKYITDIEFYDFDQMTNEDIIIDDKKGRFDGMQVTKANSKGKIQRAYNEHKKECEQNYILPILSNCVTSYQRVALHRDLVLLDGLYCDTDCILTEQECEDNFELGGLKLEKKVSHGWLIRPKCYMIYDTIIEDNKNKIGFGYAKGWTYKVKGLSKMSNEKFMQVLINESIEQFKFMKIKEAMKRGYTPNQKMKFKKKQDIEDNKRDWLGQKFNKEILQDSKPIYINEKIK